MASKLNRRSAGRPLALVGAGVRAELLEPRALLSSTVLSLSAPEIVHSVSRSMLYLIGAKSVTGYDLLGQGRGTTWNVGQSLRGADVTRDGEYLYVNDGVLVDGKGVIRRVDLDDGGVTDLTYDIPEGTGQRGGEELVVTSTRTAVFTARGHAGLYELNLASGAVSTVAAPAGLPSGFSGAELVRLPGRDAVLVAGLATPSEAEATPPVFVYDAGANTFEPGNLPARGNLAAVSPDGSTVAMNVWFSGGPGAPVTDLKTNATRRLPDGELPIAFDPVRPLLYTLRNTGAHGRPEPDLISAFDTATLTKQFDFSADVNVDIDGFPPLVATVADDGSQMFVRMPPGEDVGYDKLGAHLRSFPLAPAPVISNFGAPARPDDGLRVAADEPVTFTVTMRDRAGNLLTDFAGTVAFHSTYADLGFSPPPPITFTPADGGVRTATVTFPTGQFRQGPPPRLLRFTAVDTATGASDSVTDLVVDAAAPNALLPSADPSTFAGGVVDVRVVYSDDGAVDLATLGDDDLVIRGPDGAELPVRLRSHRVTGYVTSPSVEADYELRPLDGSSWDHAENGVYEISIRPGAVADTVGNAISDPPSDTFTIDLAAPPPPPPSGPRPDAVVSVRMKAGRAIFTGAMVTGTVTVRNKGDAPLREAWVDVNLHSSSGHDVGLATFTHDFDLMPGKSARFTVRRAVPHGAPNDFHRMTALVDPLGGIDLDYSNNEAESGRVAIRRGGGAVFSPPADAAVSLVPGRSHTAKFTLRNIDEYDMARTDYVLEVAASTSSSHLDTVAPLLRVVQPVSLATGKQKTVTLRFTVPESLPAGQYWLLLDARVVEPVEPVVTGIVIR